MVVIAEKASKAQDKLPLCLQLEKMVKALVNNSFKTTAQPLVMARMCQFIGKFASCFKSCSSVDVFHMASKLVMASFDRGVSEYSHQGHVAYSSHVSPLSEASDAIKQLLWASPDQFSPEAKLALENAWKLPYTCQQEVIAIEDREMLSSGLCAVVVSLPAEQWNSTLDALAQPILSCLNVITREADQVTGSPSGVGQCEKPMEPMMNRLSNEIRLLASTVGNFIKAGKSKKFSGEDMAKMSTCHRNALVSLLHKSWPSLTHIGRSYCPQHDVIASAIGQLMSESLSYGSEEDMPLLLEITGLAKTSLIEVVKSKNADALAPLLSFMQKFILLHGPKIEPGPRNNATHEPIQVMAKNLMLLSYQAVRSCSKASKDSHVSHGMASPMFETLSACAKKCPIFLLGLSRDSQPVGEVVRSSIETSPTVLKSNELDVVLSSIKYLKQLTSSLASISSESLNEELQPLVNHIKHSIQTDVLATISASACLGISPPEVIEPSADLMRVILQVSQWHDVEPSLSSAINCGQFQLGDEARSVALNSFRKCAESEYISISIVEMVSSIWEMHQSIDSGSIAGGEVVVDFVHKYRVN
jgi:hypothetical protein